MEKDGNMKLKGTVDVISSRIKLQINFLNSNGEDILIFFLKRERKSEDSKKVIFDILKAYVYYFCFCFKEFLNIFNRNFF